MIKGYCCDAQHQERDHQTFAKQDCFSGSPVGFLHGLRTADAECLGSGRAGKERTHAGISAHDGGIQEIRSFPVRNEDPENGDKEKV